VPSDSGITAYDAGVTYSNSPTIYVEYSGNIWKFINPVPQTGVTPGTDILSWELSSAGVFVHERNKDEYLDFGGTNQISASEIISGLAAATLGYVPLAVDGRNANGADQDWGGYGIKNISLISDSGEVDSIDVENKFLKVGSQVAFDWLSRQIANSSAAVTGDFEYCTLNDIGGAPFLYFGSKTDGLGVTTNGWIARLKTTNLTATQTYELPTLGGTFARLDDIADAIVGVYKDQGNFTPSGNYPTIADTLLGDAPKVGYTWVISGLGVGVTALVGTKVVSDGDVVRVLVAPPAQVNANWSIVQNNLEYVPENIANKKNATTAIPNTDDYYSTQGLEDRLSQAVNSKFYDDFYNLNNWTQTAISGGSSAPQFELSGENGVTLMSTGVSSSGSFSIKLGQVNLTTHALECACKIRTSTLSTVTDEYSVFVGLNALANSLGTHLVGFSYDRTIDGNFWVVYTRSAGVTTKTVSSVVVVASTQYRLKCVINASATSVGFYIATGATGAYGLIATHTTNIPSFVNSLNHNVFITKTVGSTASALFIDNWRHKSTSIARID